MNDPQLTFGEISKYIANKQFHKAVPFFNQLDKKILLSNSALLNAYGVTLRGIGNPELAIDMYHLALKLEPNQMGVWSNLGNALKDANYLNASMKAHERALELSKSPDSRLLHNYGLALAMSGKHDLAIDVLLRACKQFPEKKNIRWDLARSYLAIGDYENGFKNYQYRWVMDDAPPQRVYGREWNGEAVKTESVFVYSEQGFGDCIQCIRYLPDLQKRVKNLQVEVRPELHELFENSFPEIQFINYTSNRLEIKDGYIVSLLDLPQFFQIKEPTGQPYLKPRPDNIEIPNSITKILHGEKSLNIGIIWSGSVTFKRNQFRSAPVEYFYKSFALPNVNLFSLQLGPRSQDLQQLPFPLISNDLIPFIKSFNDTALLVKKLDLVIMTCSSAAHLCGALGVPCWILLDSSPHWLWGVNKDYSPWYDSVRLYRQKDPGNWLSVFDDVSADLMDLVKIKND